MIYYVEDDEQIRNLTSYTLIQAGYEVCGFTCAQELFDALNTALPELILLDVMLPGQDGISICATLRRHERTADIPIMMLTAKSTEYDTVTGLDAGADDYLAKPFGMMELLSRVNALLRRTQRHATLAQSEDMLTNGCISVDCTAHSVLVDGVAVVLTRKEFDLLVYLMRRKGAVVTRERLLAGVWNYDIMGETRTVDAHVQTLRKKLAAQSADAAALIVTVRGVGYRMRSDAE